MTEIVEDRGLSKTRQEPHAEALACKPLVAAVVNLRTYGILLALILLVVAVDIADPSFLSSANVANMLGQWALTGVMAVGMTFVIIAGGFDLSIASGFSLCA